MNKNIEIIDFSKKNIENINTLRKEISLYFKNKNYLYDTYFLKIKNKSKIIEDLKLEYYFKTKKNIDVNLKFTTFFVNDILIRMI